MTTLVKSAVLGRPFKIRLGGSTDLIHTEDAARALLAAAASRLDGARVYDLHGASVAIAGLVRMIEAARRKARGLIAHGEQPIPFPAELKKTLDEFARLQTKGRLDARELT